MDVGQDRNAAEIVEAICDMRQIIGNCLIKLLAGSKERLLQSIAEHNAKRL